MIKKKVIAGVFVGYHGTHFTLGSFNILHTLYVTTDYNEARDHAIRANGNGYVLHLYGLGQPDTMRDLRTGASMISYDALLSFKVYVGKYDAVSGYSEQPSYNCWNLPNYD